MKDLFLNNTMNLIKSKYDFNETKLAELKYGLHCIYLTITKLTVIVVVATFLGIIKEMFLFIIFYNFLRSNGGGFHANKSWQCWLLSVPIFLLAAYLISQLVINYYIKIIISVLCAVILTIFAPADTKKRPIVNKEKRRKRKLFILFLSSIYICIIMLTNNNSLSNVLLISLIIETILINPLIYKLFKEPYNNYKNYKYKI